MCTFVHPITRYSSLRLHSQPAQIFRACPGSEGSVVASTEFGGKQSRDIGPRSRKFKKAIMSNVKWSPFISHIKGSCSLLLLTQSDPTHPCWGVGTSTLFLKMRKQKSIRRHISMSLFWFHFNNIYFDYYLITTKNMKSLGVNHDFLPVVLDALIK